VIAGIISYVILNGIPLVLKKITGGRILPPNYDASEEWIIPPGGIIPVWM
jgi:AGZA family xanthine/uracil permease-like MFS transporter